MTITITLLAIQALEQILTLISSLRLFSRTDTFLVSTDVGIIYLFIVDEQIVLDNAKISNCKIQLHQILI